MKSRGEGGGWSEEDVDDPLAEGKVVASVSSKRGRRGGWRVREGAIRLVM